jgi:hypothetical protein
LVGREEELLLLSGEAGIGKSRLTAALLESVASEPHTTVFGSAIPCRRAAKFGVSPTMPRSCASPATHF